MKRFLKKNNSIPAFLKNILYNRMILYFILFLSIINMTTIALMGDFVTPLVFILVGVITSYFNKNMLIILTLSLAVSNILKYGKKLAINEGMTTEQNDEEQEEEEETPEKKSTATTATTATPTNKQKTVSKKEEPTEEAFQEFLETQKKIKGIVENMDDQINQVTNQLDIMKKNIKK